MPTGAPRSFGVQLKALREAAGFTQEELATSAGPSVHTVSARAAASKAAADQRRGVSLPLALTVLLGRDADVQTLLMWLADPTARLITLTGPGGVGKTRLALELARAKAAEGACPVVFVSLAAIRNGAFGARALRYAH